MTFNIAVDATAEEIVAAINRWANLTEGELAAIRLYVERKRLWDFLTALRGPDSRKVNLKRETTELIRIPLRHLAYSAEALVRPTKDWNWNALIDLTNMDTKNDHFLQHIASAAGATNDWKVS